MSHLWVRLKTLLDTLILISCIGYVSWLHKLAKNDSAVVELLRKSGAVFYVKTNIPQTLMVRFGPYCR